MPTVAIARARECVVVRVQGRGTRTVARAIDRLAATIAPEDPLVIDLAPTDAVESSFLGCLAALAKRRHRGFSAAGPALHLHALFGRTGLERVVSTRDQAPPAGEYSPIEDPGGDDPHSLGAFVVSCHRHLAACGGPDAAVHAAVADRLERELTK